MIRDAGTKARQELEVLLGARVYLETGYGSTRTGSAGRTPSTASASDGLSEDLRRATAGPRPTGALRRLLELLVGQFGRG